MTGVEKVRVKENQNCCCNDRVARVEKLSKSKKIETAIVMTTL